MIKTTITYCTTDISYFFCFFQLNPISTRRSFKPREQEELLTFVFYGSRITNRTNFCKVCLWRRFIAYVLYNLVMGYRFYHRRLLCGRSPMFVIFIPKQSVYPWCFILKYNNIPPQDI